MRTSHRQIRKRILDAKSKITDEEFFSSRAYNGYLTDLAEAATKRYKRPLRVRVVADHDDETVAFTDYHGIYINACNHITWSFPSRLLRSMSLEGLNAHECGHNLFTDERIWHSYFAGLAKGKFYPKMPDGLDSMQKLYAKDILEALTDDTDTVPMQVIMSTAHALSNILEDGYVDARYSYEFPGSPAKGIALNNLRYADTMPEITEMINRKYYDHSIVVNLLIQYVRAHEVNNLSGYTGEFIDKLYEYIPWIDESVYDDDARSRCEAANRILVDLWPMMQRCFDALRDKQKQAQQQAQQSSQQTGKGGSGSGSGQPGSGDDDNDGSQQGQQAVEEDLSSQLPKAAANFTIKTKPVPSNGTFTPNPGQMNAIRAQVERVIAEETSRIAAHLTNGITSSGNGGVDQNSEYEGNDYEHAADDIERLLSSMAEEKVTEELEEELSEELQREANAIRYGNAHRNIHVTVNRMAHVDQNLIDSYNRVAPELLMLSKRLQRSVSSALRDRRQGGKQTGLLIGKRLNQHALYRNDGRIFYNSRLPTEPINLSVGLLIDESGSMCSNDRITRARATAIVIQDFCESLGIPLLVVGHTAWSSHVELFSYLLDDSNPEERALALSFGASLLALCDRFVIYGDRISSGMKEEIRRARELGIPILNRQTQLSDGSSDPVIVGRYINGISLNGLEYLKNDADEVIYFVGVEAAKAYLREHGITEDEMEDMVFRKSVGTCFRCGDPLFLSDIPEYTCQCFRCDEDFYSIEQDVDL